MNIGSLLKNPTLRHNEFPITSHKTFLAHAATSPLPHYVSSAIFDYVKSASSIGQWEYLYRETEAETRRFAANLINADEEEISFVSSTSMGLSTVASGLQWNKGDNVIVTDGDFPSNIYPWLNLRSKGVQVKYIPRNKEGAVTLKDVCEIIDKDTRLVSLSTVNFVSGFIIDISSIGEYLQKNDILFCVDAIQSLGAVSVDTTYVDFLASSAHKWLLGPLGIGILYIKKKNIKNIYPILAGWKSVEDCNNYLNYNLNFLGSAQRFEPGALNIIGIIGLHAALKMLLEIKIENISERLRNVREILVYSLKAKGYEIVGPTDSRFSSGITSFTSKNRDITNLREELVSNGFIVSLRHGLNGNKCIRVSPHFYNTDDEISRFLSSIPNAIC